MLLTLKLIMTPLLIAFVTLVGRRWGHAIGGWLMGFPLTSGPVSILLALQYGPDFAARAAVGTLGGQASVCIFCLTYTIVSQVADWPLSSALAVVSFMVSIFFWNTLGLSLLPTLGLAVILTALILWFIPNPPDSSTASQAPQWDIPARMIAAATFVVLLTTFANILGPQLSGLISPFPVFGVVIAAFTHYRDGAPASAHLLRGVVLGSFAFNGFFLIVALLLPTMSIGWTYAAATAAALVINSITLLSLQEKAKA